MCNPIFSREIGPAISKFVLIKQVLLCTLNTEYVFCTMTHLSRILIFVSGSPLVKSELIIWKFSYRSCSQVSYDFIYALILGEVGSVFQGQLTWLCAFSFSKFYCWTYPQKHHQYTTLRNKHDIDVMRQCEIIGMTVTGAAMRANLLGKLTTRCICCCCCCWCYWCEYVGGSAGANSFHLLINFRLYV